MAYSKKVIEHFENPKNVGSLDKDDKDVGTGIVGAPECFHGDTYIAVADGRRCVKLKDLYKENNIVPVWSYNISNKCFEIKNAKCIKTGMKNTHTIDLSDGGQITLTPDHKFLMLPDYTYIENEKLQSSDSIVYFRRFIDKRGHWNDFKQQAINYNHFVKKRINTGLRKTYTLQVEDNNNYVVLSNITKNIHEGIVVKNCGDVMKLQLKINKEGIIEDAKFRTFGCLASNTIIACPGGYKTIDKLRKGSVIFAYNGEKIVENKIVKIIKHKVHYTELIKFEFEGSHHFNFTCTKDHIWWSADNKPIEADNLEIGDELFHMTENELRSKNNIGRKKWNGLKVISKKYLNDKRQLRGLKRDGEYVYVYDLELKENAHVFFAGRVGTHNCGSAIASSSYITELVKGKHIDEAAKVSNTKIVQALNLPPVKIHCSVLAEDAIKAALEDYKNKNVELKHEKRK